MTKEKHYKLRFQSTVQALARIYHNDEQIHMKTCTCPKYREEVNYIIVGRQLKVREVKLKDNQGIIVKHKLCQTHDLHWGNRITAMANVRLNVARHLLWLFLAIATVAIHTGIYATPSAATDNFNCINLMPELLSLANAFFIGMLLTLMATGVSSQIDRLVIILAGRR
ncbi:hypothetical protein ACJX0J_041220, partial [Zea mays]